MPLHVRNKLASSIQNCRLSWQLSVRRFLPRAGPLPCFYSQLKVIKHNEKVKLLVLWLGFDTCSWIMRWNTCNCTLFSYYSCFCWTIRFFGHSDFILGAIFSRVLYWDLLFTFFGVCVSRYFWIIVTLYLKFYSLKFCCPSSNSSDWRNFLY